MRRLIVIPTIALIALAPAAALAAPDAHMRYNVHVLDKASSTGDIINNAHTNQHVQVWECDRGNVYCRIRLPGPDGWVPSGSLRMDDAVLPCTPAAKCLPDLDS